jgi:hypothetical protein
LQSAWILCLGLCALNLRVPSRNNIQLEEHPG